MFVSCGGLIPRCKLLGAFFYWDYPVINPLLEPWSPPFDTPEYAIVNGVDDTESIIHRKLSDGLLKPSFHPDADLVALRPLLRHRARLIEHRAPHVLHMQQALLQMHIPLSHARSDVTGITGQRIIRAIVPGERDPPTLADLDH